MGKAWRFDKTVLCWVLGFIMAGLAVAAWMGSKATSDRMSRVLHGAMLRLNMESDVDTLTTTWDSAKGTHTITTTRMEGEGLEQFVARHLATVEAAQAACPPIND